MIDRSQLAQALGRLGPREREILDYSLHRRVPDEDLAQTFDASAEDVARQRTAAIERLSEEMGVQQAADLGHMLKALLEPATWDLLLPVAPPLAEDAKQHTGPDEADAEERPLPTEEDAVQHPAPGEADAEQRPAPGEADAEERSLPREEEAEQRSASVEEEAEERSAPGAEDAEQPPPRRGGRRLAIGIAAAVSLLVPPALVVAALSAHGGGEGEPPKAAASDPRTFTPHAKPVGDSGFSSQAKRANRYPTVHVRGRTALRDRPGGKVKLRIAGKTEFDSPRVLGVVEQRGDWLAVLVPELKNGEVGWIEADAVDRFDSVAVSMRVDLSKRELVVRRGDRAVRRMKIGVGRSTNPTPKGRYAVTDTLRVTDPGSPYDCCALALTGHQTNLPEGWPGGDRLAVHATRDTGGLGQAVSLGCMRADPRDARWMLKAIPLGTPVFVRA